MNIYKIWVDNWLGYETYDSAIVVASSEEAARHIHPASRYDSPVRGYNRETNRYDKPWYEGDTSSAYSDWALPENVNVELVGTTNSYVEGTVLCASFNAG